MTRPFVLRPGEPRNPLAWLGVAPLVMARRFPLIRLGGTQAIYTAPVEDLTNLQLGHFMSELDWRRVLLPMLIEEAKKRGIDV